MMKDYEQVPVGNRRPPVPASLRYNRGPRKVEKIIVPDGRPPLASDPHEDTRRWEENRDSIETVTEKREELEEYIQRALSEFTFNSRYPVRAVHVLYTSSDDGPDAAFSYDVEVRLGFRNST